VAGLRERLSGGVSVLVDTDVPVGAGLSSSAALTCSVALALSDLVAPELRPQALVELARAAENDFVGAPTGILDQSASVLCTAGHALFLDTRDRTSEQVPLDLETAGLALLVVDSGVTHDHAEGGYGDRRRECETAAERLGVGLLREIEDVAELDVLADGTPEGDVLFRRARHIVTEDARVLDVVAALRSGADPRTVGPALTASHASMRDDFEITVPTVDLAVETARTAGALGARMTGGGFGGCIIALVERGRADEVGRAVADAFAAAGHGAPEWFVGLPSPGARRLS
jgi:galactokinase